MTECTLSPPHAFIFIKSLSLGREISIKGQVRLCICQSTVELAVASQKKYFFMFQNQPSSWLTGNPIRVTIHFPLYSDFPGLGVKPTNTSPFTSGSPIQKNNLKWSCLNILRLDSILFLFF